MTGKVSDEAVELRDSLEVCVPPGVGFGKASGDEAAPKRKVPCLRGMVLCVAWETVPGLGACCDAFLAWRLFQRGNWVMDASGRAKRDERVSQWQKDKMHRH